MPKIYPLSSELFLEYNLFNEKTRDLILTEEKFEKTYHSPIVKVIKTSGKLICELKNNESFNIHLLEESIIKIILNRIDISKEENTERIEELIKGFRKAEQKS